MALNTVEEAWDHLNRRVANHVSAEYSCQRVSECAREDDLALAAFIDKKKGVFEEYLLTHAAELQRSPGGDALVEGTNVSHVLCGASCECGPDGGPDRAPLDATLAVLDPLKILHLCRHMLWHHHRSDWSENTASFFAERLGRVPEPHEAPPELRDSISFLRCSNSKHAPSDSGPIMLPPDLGGMKFRDVEHAFEQYVGVPIGLIEARLRPGNCSSTGFLAPNEGLAAVLCEDARRLRDLGVDRSELAGRLIEVLRLALRMRDEGMKESPPRLIGGWGCPPCELSLGTEFVTFRVWISGTFGLQENPFHTIGTDLTSWAFLIENAQLGQKYELKGSGLARALIRRFGFFEGRVPYRVEPERAARVLGFLP